MFSEKEKPPPLYEDVINGTAKCKEPAYRLFLHYNRKHVACTLDQDADIDAIGSLNFYTQGIPMSSIYPGSVPIEGISSAIDPNKFVTVVLESDSLSYLQGVAIEYYTSRDIWEHRGREYMGMNFPLYHKYTAKSVKQVLFYQNKKAGFHLLVVTSSWKFFTKSLIGIYLYGNPQKKCKYALQITFKRPFTERKDCFPDCKGDLITRYASKESAFKSIIFENDKVIDSQVKEKYKGPTLDVVLKSPSIGCLKAIERYYMDMHLPNEEPHSQATVVSVCKESLESIEEESGCLKVTAKLQNYSVVYHPSVSFDDPVSWDEPVNYIIIPSRKCDRCNKTVYVFEQP